MRQRPKSQYANKPKCPDILGGWEEDFPFLIMDAKLTRTKIKPDKPAEYYFEGGNPMLELELQLLEHASSDYAQCKGYKCRYWVVLDTPGAQKAHAFMAKKAEEFLCNMLGDAAPPSGQVDPTLLLGKRGVLTASTGLRSATDRQTGGEFTYRILHVIAIHAEGWRDQGSQEPEWQKPEPDGSPEEPPSLPLTSDDDSIPF